MRDWALGSQMTVQLGGTAIWFFGKQAVPALIINALALKLLAFCAERQVQLRVSLALRFCGHLHAEIGWKHG